MEKIWFKNYPPSVPHEIDMAEFATVVDVLKKSCAKYTGRTAFSNMGKALSYNELDRLSRNFAAYLQKDLGLEKGDRIAIQMPNCLQYPIVMFGALRAGLVIVNTNPLYTPREMEHQFKDSGAKAIVIVSNFASNLEKIIANTQIKHVILTEIGDMFSFPKNLIFNFVVRYVKNMVPDYNLPQAKSFMECLRKGASLAFEAPPLSPNDLAFLQYTGGTTGVSKGAMLSHANLVANMQQIGVWIASVLEEGKEVMITALPLYHIFSLTVNCLAMMKLGAESVLITNPKDLNAFVKILSTTPYTILSGVNTLFNGLLHNPDFCKLDFSKLKTVVGGGMAVQKAVADKWKQVTGTSLVEGYGLTESSPVLTCNRIDGHERIGTIGLPVPSTDISIRDDDGKEVAFGEPGEICGKGPQVMMGYWQRPEETAKVIKDGWLYTGDIAVVTEDGYFKIVDRKKDMILVSGFNVYPNEVEDVVATHPGVLEVAAIGVPDDKSGEAVKIVVVKKDPELNEADLRAFCKKNLTGYKIPRFVEFRTELPKSNVGKILRRELKTPQPSTSA